MEEFQKKIENFLEGFEKDSQNLKTAQRCLYVALDESVVEHINDKIDKVMSNFTDLVRHHQSIILELVSTLDICKSTGASTEFKSQIAKDCLNRNKEIIELFLNRRLSNED